jgi:hypothetical protein
MRSKARTHFFIAAKTAAGLPLRLALTYACATPAHHAEILVCTLATLTYVTGSHLDIRWRDGRVERSYLPAFDPLTENLRHYARYLRGLAPRPATTLADSRPFVHLHALAYVASGRIHPFPSELVRTLPDPASQDTRIHVEGLEAACERFLRESRWPDARLGAPAEPAPPLRASQLDLLRPVIEAMSAAVAV